MKKILTTIMILGTLVTITGCTAQSKAKNFGGTYELKLEKGRKLINVTWKEDELWYLTRSMTDNDKAENYEFKEDSNFGVMEGKVVIKESK